MWCQEILAHVVGDMELHLHIRLESFKSVNPLSGAILTSSGCGKQTHSADKNDRSS